MGKKSWFSTVKKVVTPSCTKIKKEKRSHKSKSNTKNAWLAQMSLETWSSKTEPNPFHHYHPIGLKVPEDEQIKHVDSVTYVATIELTTSKAHFQGKTTEEICAIKIQAAYRGYKARRAFRSLRAMSRLNLLMQGQAAKYQTTSTLKRIEIMGRVRSQVRGRRIRMAEANNTLRRQLKQKREKVHQKKAFDLSPKSKEQVDAMLKNRKVATERREKALAYASSRQQTWRKSQKSTCVAPNTLACGWSWSHRWNALRPWETGTTSNKASTSCQISKLANPKVKNTRSMVGLAKNRHLVVNSKSSVSKRSISATKKNSITIKSR